jgi:hypothetical protein
VPGRRFGLTASPQSALLPCAGMFPTTGRGYRRLRSDLEHRFGMLSSAEGRAAHPSTPEAERMSDRVPGRSIQDVEECSTGRRLGGPTRTKDATMPPMRAPNQTT